jgi:hypothetical protein
MRMWRSVRYSPIHSLPRHYVEMSGQLYPRYLLGRRLSGSQNRSGCSGEEKKYEGVSKSFRTGRLERELQIVQLSATKCSCIAILWLSLVSFAAIALYVASEWVFIVVISLSTQSGNFWIHLRICHCRESNTGRPSRDWAIPARQ